MEGAGDQDRIRGDSLTEDPQSISTRASAGNFRHDRNPSGEQRGRGRKISTATGMQSTIRNTDHWQRSA